MSTYPADPESVALDQDAKRILAAAGVEHTADNYMLAVEAAKEANAQDEMLRRALIDLGIDPKTEPETVTEAMIASRAAAILAENAGGDASDATEEDRLEAYKQAIEELGAPGEPRKDQTPAAAASQLLEAALAEELIDETTALAFRTLIANGDEPQAEQTLRVIVDHERRKRAAWLTGCENADPERASDVVLHGQHEHEAAEALIAHAGIADYGVDDYTSALGAVQEVMAARGCSPREALQVIAEKALPGPTPAVTLGRAVAAAGWVARAAREKAEEEATAA